MMRLNASQSDMPLFSPCDGVEGTSHSSSVLGGWRNRTKGCDPLFLGLLGDWLLCRGVTFHAHRGASSDPFGPSLPPCQASFSFSALLDPNPQGGFHHLLKPGGSWPQFLYSLDCLPVYPSPFFLLFFFKPTLFLSCDGLGGWSLEFPKEKF